MRSIFALLALSIALTLTPSQPALAQLCGDADGNGEVTVTDGVQTLRAAANLSSSCSIAVCDVDGSGAITVTDGVNVLRKAAGLPVDEHCGGTDAEVETVLSEVQPLLTVVLGFATGTPVTSCANAPDGDIQTNLSDPTTGTDTTFTTCQVGNIELDGDIIVSATSFNVSVLEVDTAVTGDFIAQYDSSEDLTLNVVGQGRSLSGPMDVSSNSAGDFTISFNGAIVTNGKLTGGGAMLDLTGSDIENSLSTIQLTFDNSEIAQVMATAKDGSTKNYRFDLAQSVLVP
jgi:hypothetical protein